MPDSPASDDSAVPDAPVRPRTPWEDSESGRRRFVRNLILVPLGVAATGYPLFRFAVAPALREWSAGTSTVAVPDAELPPPGSAAMFEHHGWSVLLIHHRDGTLLAFDAICPHQGCTVEFEAQYERLLCPCHAGVFSPWDGTPVSGPPREPLGSWLVERREGEVVLRPA